MLSNTQLQFVNFIFWQVDALSKLAEYVKYFVLRGDKPFLEELALSVDFLNLELWIFSILKIVSD